MSSSLLSIWSAVPRVPMCTACVLLLCGSEIGGSVHRCPISAIGRLSSSVRRFSLCIRSILADRKSPPRPYDAKCACSVLALLESEVFTCGAVSLWLLVVPIGIPVYRYAAIPFRYIHPVQCSAMSRRVGCPVRAISMSANTLFLASG